MLRSVSIPAVCSLVFLAAGAGHAASVLTPAIVTFDQGSGYHSSIRYDGNRAQGTWEESGFSVDWEMYDARPSGLSVARVDQFNDSVFLSDTEGTPDQTTASITFTRNDGAAFSLSKFELPQSTASSWVGEMMFTPLASDGSMDYANQVYERFDVAYGNLRLSGVTAGGDTVQMTINSFEEGTTAAFASGPFASSGDGIVDVPAGALGNLTSLKLELGVFDQMDALFRQSLSLSQSDPFFRLGLEACMATSGAAVSTCMVDGIGEFSFFASSGHFQNWGSAVSVDRFAFEVAEIAPMPLPAGAALLIAALAGLGLIRRHRAAG